MALGVTLKHWGDTFISFKILKEPILVKKQTASAGHVEQNEDKGELCNLV